MNKKIRKGIIIVLMVFITGIIVGYSIKEPKKQFVTKKVIVEKGKTTNDILKKENIVFLGDSITDYYPVDEIFNLPIINSGKSGYKTDQIIPELKELVYQYNPTSVYILIGTNDFRDEDDDKLVNEVEENIVKIVEDIQKYRSKSKIYIQSIYPINKTIKNNNTDHRENEEIIEVNNYLEEYCKKNNLTYIDMYNKLIDEDGNLSKEYTNDGLHPNELGYSRITRELIPFIYGIEK